LWSSSSSRTLVVPSRPPTSPAADIPPLEAPDPVKTPVSTYQPSFAQNRATKRSTMRPRLRTTTVSPSWIQRAS
jgi:hypothetical protein